MDKIDLDAIIDNHPRFALFSSTGTIGQDIRTMLEEAIHQALVLASKKRRDEADNLAFFIRGKVLEGARTNAEILMHVHHFYESDEYANQRFPILNVEKLIV